MGHIVGTKEHHCPVAVPQALDGGVDIISHYNLLGDEMAVCDKKTRKKKKKNKQQQQKLRLRNEKGDQSPEIGSIYGSCFPSEAGIVAEF